MTVTAANDIGSLYNVSSDAVKNILAGSSDTAQGDNENMFGSILNAAISNINDTNNCISDWENEEMKWAMGISENTHDLTIAIGKAETALQYTVAVRDKLLSAYNEIMQIQI